MSGQSGLGGLGDNAKERERERDRLDLSDIEHRTMVLIAEISWRSLWRHGSRGSLQRWWWLGKEGKRESVEKRRIDGRGGRETDRFVGRSSAWLVWITETIATSSLQRRRYVFAASNEAV